VKFCVCRHNRVFGITCGMSYCRIHDTLRIYSPCAAHLPFGGGGALGEDEGDCALRIACCKAHPAPTITYF
jgi:hypothetical protein